VAEADDRYLEGILRSALRAETRGLDVTVTAQQLLSRRAGRRLRGRHWFRPLLLAATLMVATGLALAAATVSPTPEPSPVAALPRLLVVRGLTDDHISDATTGLEVILLSVDGTTESVAKVPAEWFPSNLYFPLWRPTWPSPDVVSFDASTADTGAPYTVSIDLADPDAGVEVSPGSRLSDGVFPYDGPVPCGGLDEPCHSGVEAGIETGPAADGSWRAWASAPPEGSFHSLGSWAADGGVWFATETVAGDTRSLRLTHVSPDGTATTSPPFAIPPGMGAMVDSAAPDDGLVAVRIDSELDDRVAVIDPVTGAGASVSGWSAGWVDETRAARLRRSGSPSAPGEPLGTSAPAYRQLESFETQASRLRIERIVFQHEEPAMSDPAPFSTGDIAVTPAYGVSLECAGPGQLHLSDPVGLIDRLSLERDCEMFAGGIIGGTWRERGDLVSMTIQADPGVAWRLIVYEDVDTP
jgi:hypothetical protein